MTCSFTEGRQNGAVWAVGFSHSPVLLLIRVAKIEEPSIDELRKIKVIDLQLSGKA